VRAGLLTGFKTTGARARLAFAVRGQAVEEWAACTVTSVTQKTFSATAAYHGGLTETTSYMISAANLTACRAPAGELDRSADLFAVILSSIRPHQPWLAAVSQTQMAIAKTQIQGAADRSRIWTQASREIGDIYTDAYRNQQAVQDRLASRWSRTIRGVETYADPHTSERYALPSGFRDVWVSKVRDEYILSNDSSFDPNQLDAQAWQRVDAVR
jgi:hypothetical protein